MSDKYLEQYLKKRRESWLIKAVFLLAVLFIADEIRDPYLVFYVAGKHAVANPPNDQCSKLVEFSMPFTDKTYYGTVVSNSEAWLTAYNTDSQAEQKDHVAVCRLLRNLRDSEQEMEVRSD